jgi:hypothetical protein
MSMQYSRFTKIAVRATAALAALLLGMAALSVLERRRTQAELSAVLSALFSDAVLRHDSASGRGIQVIILRDGPGRQLERSWNWLFDRETLFPQSSRITRSSFFLSNAITAHTPAELHLPKGVDFVVLSRGELERGQLGNFEGRSLDDMESFAISQLGLNFSKTEAILYIEYSCFRVTDLCSGGYFILMRKVNGVWRVVDRSNTWAS